MYLMCCKKESINVYYKKKSCQKLTNSSLIISNKYQKLKVFRIILCYSLLSLHQSQLHNIFAFKFIKQSASASWMLLNFNRNLQNFNEIEFVLNVILKFFTEILSSARKILKIGMDDLCENIVWAKNTNIIHILLQNCYLKRSYDSNVVVFHHPISW